MRALCEGTISEYHNIEIPLKKASKIYGNGNYPILYQQESASDQKRKAATQSLTFNGIFKSFYAKIIPKKYETSARKLLLSK